MIVDPSTAVVIGLTFLLAGTVKGVIGLGLPTVSLGVLTAALDLTTAMALLIVPSFVTNVWQAMAGRNTQQIVRRIRLFLVLATLAVWPGSYALATVELSTLSMLLGTLLLIYGGVSLAGLRVCVPSKHESSAGIVFGAVNGLLTGMTGSFVVPGVMYLQALGLSRDDLVQAMGMLFTLSTIALAFSLQQNHILSFELGVISSMALLPALAGMLAGQRLRKNMPEQLFRRVFFAGILLLGAYIVVRSL